MVEKREDISRGGGKSQKLLGPIDEKRVEDALVKKKVQEGGGENLI